MHLWTLLLAAMLAAITPIACAQDEDDDDADEPKAIVIDLGKDGSMEKIWLEKTKKKDVGQFYRLVVSDDEGNEIWSGPKSADITDPLVFGSLDYGVCLPEVVGDIDGDGELELVAPEPVSDVSPVTFRVLRWTGEEFEHVRSKALFEDPENEGRFPWRSTEEYKGRWISKFVKVSDSGDVTVDVTDFRGGGSAGMGKAVVKAVKGGFEVKKWIDEPERPTPPKDDSSDNTDSKPDADSDAGTNGNATPPDTPGQLARYMCQIGDEDLRNSAGDRLTKVAEILQMDRANYHRFKVRHRRDLDDETYFASPQTRLLFEQVPVRANERLAKWIREGGAIVVVTAYPDHIEVSQPE